MTVLSALRKRKQHVNILNNNNNNNDNNNNNNNNNKEEERKKKKKKNKNNKCQLGRGGTCGGGMWDIKIR